MNSFKEKMEWVLGYYRPMGVVVTISSEHKGDGYLTMLAYLKRYFGWVAVCETPAEFEEQFSEGERPAFVPVEDKFFGSFTGMLEAVGKVLHGYQESLPSVVFLCSSSIQFISKSIQSHLPSLKRSAVFAKPLRSVTLHAYLLATVHHHHEVLRYGKAKQGTGALLKYYEKALIQDNPAMLEEVMALSRSES